MKRIASRIISIMLPVVKTVVSCYDPPMPTDNDLNKALRLYAERLAKVNQPIRELVAQAQADIVRALATLSPVVQQVTFPSR